MSIDHDSTGSDARRQVRKGLDRSYRVIDDFEHGVMMVRSDGENLSMDEIRAAYSALRNAYHVQQKTKAQKDIREILPDAEWVFPDSWRDLKRSGECVYFAVSTALPDVIKIGYSGNVAKRRKSLGSDRPGTFRIVAFIKTGRAQDLETAFHYRFEHLRDGRTEFFQREPVMSFVEQFRGGAS